MIYHGDCVAVMAGMEAASVDAIVTDPPYDLTSIVRRFGKDGSRPTPAMKTSSPQYGRLGRGFMGKTWDGTGIAFRQETWTEALRVAKPGAYLLAFGGTRTVHRMMVAIEDAGWEIRDTLIWVYASGFPKSLDVSKAIDKAAGATRERIAGPKSGGMASLNAGNAAHGYRPDGYYDDGNQMQSSVPVTDDAEKWQGWGTALKPAWEPIVMARKPLRGTVAANVTEYGTGALNIDGCRIAGGPRPLIESKSEASANAYGDGLNGSHNAGTTTAARWPANVILTDPIFDGDVPGVAGGGETTSGTMRAGTKAADTPGDSGTYSRFFVIPKASRADREPAGHKGKRVNMHPTVKPTGLMAHLVRLVTPPNGVVLDPFAGSGSTLVAAYREDFKFIGIEQEIESIAIIEARLAAEKRSRGLWGLE